MHDFLVDSTYFGVVLTLGAFLVGLWCKRKFHLAVCNPLLIAVVLVILALTALDIDYETYNRGARYISYLLTPATVCLAIPLYQQMTLLRRNVKAVMLGISSGVLASMFGIFALSAAFGLTHEQYVTLLPKSITVAIGMDVSAELGGVVAITVAAIIVTGILGNMIASAVCRIFRIEEPIAKGLAIGTASHAIGTARALEMGAVEGAMSSLAIAVAGLLTACSASLFGAL